jgi:hypothetical protein
MNPVVPLGAAYNFLESGLGLQRLCRWITLDATFVKL